MAIKGHDPDITVRNYLLEFADAGEMVSFEDRYFTDPEFLKLVEAEEERLMEDYLLARLEPSLKKRFELLCTRNPDWPAKVDALRQRLQVQVKEPRQRNTIWFYALTTSAVAASIAFAAFFFVEKSAVKQPEAKLEMPAEAPFIEVRLSPGVNKGARQASAVSIVPAGKNRLRFTFEMPGVKGPVSCRVRLLRIEADGNQSEIATSPLSLSAPGPNSEVTFLFTNQLIPRGDLIAELTTSQGVVLNRYIFQAR